MSKLIYLLGFMVAVITSLVLTACPPAAAQTMQKFEINDKDGIAMLPEVGAIVIMENGSLKVMAVAPATSRPAAYKSVDLKEGDIVVMANGKRMAKPLNLDSLYKAAKVGDQIKLGIKRGEDMMIVAFAKADEKDLPKREIKMMGGPGGETKITRTGGPMMEIHGDVANPTPFPGFAIVAGEKDGKVVIAGQIPIPEADPRAKDLKGGDVIVSIDDKPITTVAATDELLSGIGDGQDVKFVVERDGKQQTITVTKHAVKAVIKTIGK